ncbi:MAG: hypothetical protein GXP49_14725 [Deltaproteobacteria bacterium]|nr:hypothetical protein [Deltaproteobacteria bacterium]
MKKTAFDISSRSHQVVELKNRRSLWLDITKVASELMGKIDDEKLALLEEIDMLYRTLCGVLYNFVPTSGHPGGSISSGRIVESLIFENMDYNITDPDEPSADLLCYAAGHKAMGLYAAWALRDELVRAGNSNLLPADINKRLRLEDLLGFRRNPTQETPLFKSLNAKPLDGHPTPLVPFVKVATGASGIGVTSGIGLALGALDYFGNNPPMVNMIEGEGGMTPGRVSEGMAAASAARLGNLVMHIDFNQASIDSNRVCRDGTQPGEYVQWDPAELSYLHDWNVIMVPDGKDFKQVLAAQVLAASIDNHQPTAVVYRTVKGWRYGIEGKDSHGAGHHFMSEGYFKYSVGEFQEVSGYQCPKLEGTPTAEEVEKCFYDTLMMIRRFIEEHSELARFAAERLEESIKRLKEKSRSPREKAPNIEVLYEKKEIRSELVPEELKIAPGTKTTLRATLGKVLNYLNNESNGGFLAAAADLLGSTSIKLAGEGFGEKGFFNSVDNPEARLVAMGGICEDAMGGIMGGVSSYGRHIGVSSSYGAFIAAMEHVPARLHGIGQQAKSNYNNKPYSTWVMVNAHTGIKTGEDGPTHADPQNLQLLSGNFPRGVVITLTPFDPAEIWSLVVEGLKKRPAILAPFVTRPGEIVPDRTALNIAPATDCITGLYALRRADMSAKQYNGTIVLQGSGAALAFVQEVLPELDKKGLNLNVFYVSSAELFDLLPEEKQREIYPEELSMEAMGITGLTLPTMYKWITGYEGRKRTLFPFRHGHYLGSGQAHKVMEEAGMHAKAQLEAVLDYAKMIEAKHNM